MDKTTECGKICLKADAGKMLYNSSQNVYTPKVYLFSESSESAWTEVDAATITEDEELSDGEALAIITGGQA